MPASLLEDMTSQSGLQDQRALQIALELSMLGLNQEEEQAGGSPPAMIPSFPEEGQKMKRSANMTECVPVPSSEHVAEIVGRQGCKIKALRAKTNTYIKTPVRGEEPVFVVTGRKEDVGAAKREILSAAEHFSQIRASRRNNNTGAGSGGPLAPGPPSPNAPGQVTIQVRVPYRVVGLVVGPKGATIKRIQQQTRTYIVTPSRDKEPVFEVTGTPENVDKARQEIESHIALRTGGLVESNNGLGNHGSVPATPVPNANGDDNDFHSNGVDSGFHDLNNDMISSMYKPPSSNSAFTSYNSVLNASNNLLSHAHHHNRAPHADNHTPNIFNFPSITPNANANGTAKITEYSPSLTNGFSNGFGLYDNDEGIASPVFEGNHISMWQDMSSGDNCKMANNGAPMMFNPPNTGGVGVSTVGPPPRGSNSMSSSTTPRLSPTLTDSSSNAAGGGGSPGSGVVSPGTDHSSVRRIRSDPLPAGLSTSMTFAPLSNGVLGGGGTNPGSAFNITTTSSASLSSSNNSASSSPTDSTGSASTNRRRNCLMCNDGGVVAALVPCGHNLFCMECANNIVEKPETDRRCPVCQQPPTQAIRIFS